MAGLWLTTRLWPVQNEAAENIGWMHIRAQFPSHEWHVLYLRSCTKLPLVSGGQTHPPLAQMELCMCVHMATTHTEPASPPPLQQATKQERLGNPAYVISYMDYQYISARLVLI